MNAQISNLAPPGSRRNGAHRRKTTRLAALAASASLSAIASPAFAQCVEGPPTNFTCAGQTDVSQVITADDAKVTTNPGFAVDTTNNGNGIALQVTGAGLISFEGSPDLTGAGARFSTTGSSGLSAGELSVFSNGNIFANGANALRLDNAGGGDTTAVWVGSITNIAGNGVFTSSAFGAGDLSLIVDDVSARDDGIRVSYDANGSATVTAIGPVLGHTGAGVRIVAGDASDDVDLTVGDVTGGTFGIIVDSTGTDVVKVDASGTVTGLSADGIRVSSGTDTLGIDIRAAQVSGATSGITANNQGSGNLSVIATGLVSGASEDGIYASSQGPVGDLSITATDVTGYSGIRTYNSGVGATTIIATGKVSGFGNDGINVFNDIDTTDVLVDVHDVEAAHAGIWVDVLGSGDTVVRSSGTVNSVSTGILVRTTAASQSARIDTVDVISETTGIDLIHQGTGIASVNATGNVVGLIGSGIAVDAGTGSTDIRVTAVNVTGGNFGIRTLNEGTGETYIAVTGLVVGGSDNGSYNYGILAQNREGLTTDLFLRAAEVQATSYGIIAESDGLGTMTVIADKVTSQTKAAVRVYAEKAVSAVNVTIGEATGDTTGIEVFNMASGFANIEATGTVTGLSGAGISVETGTNSTGIDLRANTVNGYNAGILTTNFGVGSTSVSATGIVTGTAANGTGIAIIGGTGSTDIRVAAVGVHGGGGGINTNNDGSGETFISATGPVSGGQYGIVARNGFGAGDLTVLTSTVESGGEGIATENNGTGETRVIATGTVAAQGEVGIHVFAGATAGDITVESGNATGALSGISAINYGIGDTRITVSGVAQGGTNGVEAFSDGNQKVVIVNNGTIRNASGLGSARAISASGGQVLIGNTGTLLGTVEIAGDTSFLINAGSWRSTGGTSNFATLDDTLFNATTGTIVGGALAASAESTVWQGLELFQNNGVLRLQDGGVGDVLQTSAATTFANGSALSVDIAGATGADVFRTIGKVTIEAGSRLQAVATQPLVLHGKHVVVQADGGLTGQFVFEDQLLTAFAGLRDGYTPTSAFIEFVQLKALASAGLTPNQKAAAGGADSLPDGNAVKDALLLLPTDAAAQAAFDQLSGEIHPSARNAMVEDSRLIRTAVLDRLGDGEPGTALWGRLFTTSGLSDGDYNAAEVDRDTKGGVIGLDRSFGSVTVGVAGGWSDTKLRIARRDSSGSIESIHGMVYAGGRFGRFGLRGGVGYAKTSTETTRRIAFQGFSASPTADYNGSVVQGFVEAGYRLPVGGGQVEPFASVTAVRARTDAFTETGGSAALSGAAITEDTMSSLVGARFETSRAGPLSLRGTVGWRHGWGDLEPAGRHTFAGGAPFTILGATGSRDAGVFNAEARFHLSPRLTFSVGYDGVLGAANADHAITGGLKIVF
jgi:outer membrane autotransporter protein